MKTEYLPCSVRQMDMSPGRNCVKNLCLTDGSLESN